MNNFCISIKYMKKIAPAIAICLLMIGCGGGKGSSTPDVTEQGYTAFSAPRLVTVQGYDGDAMEPFISRDGSTLFFNNNGPNKDMYVARAVDATTFQFVGAINAINTPAVEGAPSVDALHQFFFITTAFYSPPASYDTVFQGTWNGVTLVNVRPVSGIASNRNGFLNFDVEVSSDGSVMYFNEGDFRGGNNFPDAADIFVANKVGDAFVVSPSSASIMANINSADLEYAPTISSNQLELFFTRLYLNNLTTALFRATRNSPSEAFSSPQRVAGVTGFVEGTAFSTNEKSLYFHRRNEQNGKFELFVMTRP